MTETEAFEITAEVARGREVAQQQQREAYRCLVGREWVRRNAIALSVLITKGNIF